MDKQIKIERIIRNAPKFLNNTDDNIAQKLFVVFEKQKTDALMNAILDEMKKHHIAEAYIVNPEFVEQAIREKLIADQHRDETDKLGEAIGNIAFYNGHDEWLWKIADEMSATPKGKSYTYVFDEWHTERHMLWMMLVSAFGDWGTSMRSGWIVNTKECAEFINKATGRYASEGDT